MPIITHKKMRRDYPHVMFCELTPDEIKLFDFKNDRLAFRRIIGEWLGQYHGYWQPYHTQKIARWRNPTRVVIALKDESMAMLFKLTFSQLHT